MPESKVSPLEKMAEQFCQSSMDAGLQHKQRQAALMIEKVLAHGEEVQTTMGVRLIEQTELSHQSVAIFDFENRSYAVSLGAEDNVHALLFQEIVTVDDVWTKVAAEAFIFELGAPYIFMGNLQQALCMGNDEFILS